MRPLAEFLEKGRVVVPDPKKLLQDFGIPIVPIVKVLPSDQRADGVGAGGAEAMSIMEQWK